jgi:hypothetical protein
VLQRLLSPPLFAHLFQHVVEVQPEGIRQPQADNQAWRPLTLFGHGDHDPADPGNQAESLQRQALTFPLLPQPVHNAGKYPCRFPVVHGKQSDVEL